MTTTVTAAAETVPPQPLTTRSGLPVYRSAEAPAELCTQTQLKSRRLKLSQGQQAVAYVRINRPHPGAGDIPLYRPEDAAKMRPLSARQRSAMEARRTCVLCRTVAGSPLHERAPSTHRWLPKGGPVCEECNARHRDVWERTCERCRTEFRGRLDNRTCDGCRDILSRGQEVVRRLMRRHCPKCSAQTVTREELAAADAADPCGMAYGYPLTCAPCQADEERRVQAALWAAERDRWDELGPVRRWARQVLAEPHHYAIIDLETTGLGATARAVEIGITTASGETLLDTLVNPGEPIPEEATAQHGITDADVQDAPRFGDVLPQITKALRGRGVIIYNRSFDSGILRFEVDQYHRSHTPVLPGMSLPETEWHPAALAWMDAQQWEQCAMLAYAVHVGEWSDYWGDWAWQKLRGGHRARRDCLAVIRVLREIAEARDPEPVAGLHDGTPALPGI